MQKSGSCQKPDFSASLLYITLATSRGLLCHNHHSVPLALKSAIER